MKLLKRIFTVLLILLTFNLYIPGITFAAQGLTKHPLEIRSTPEEKMPAKEVTKKKSRWLWWVLGLAIVGGGAAAISGGGDDDGGSAGSGNTGTYTGTW